MDHRISVLLTVFVLIFTVSCGGGGGGGGELSVGGIQGPTSVNEGASAQVSVTASGDTGITYQWTCNPGSAGTLTNASGATCTFTAAAVTADTSATISVTVTSDNDGPDVAQLSITVTDVPVAPETGWAQTWGGPGGDNGALIAIDASDNIYVAGMFYNTADFDPGAGIDDHTSNGLADAFLCKYSSSGDSVWTLTWGGSDMDQPEGITIDGTGNIYVTGLFFSTADFDPGPGANEHTAVGDVDAFISKFDASGALVWVRTWGGVSEDCAWDIATDSATGDIYVTGSFYGTADFDPDSDVYNLTPVGGRDVFLARYDAAGDFKWARSWGGASLDSGSGVVVDSLHNVWTVGTFADTADFDPGAGTDTHTASGDTDSFLSEIDSSGNYLMASTWGGPNSSVFARDIELNEAQAIIVTGQFHETIDFCPGANTDIRVSKGSADAFVSRFDSTGGYNWTATWGGIDWDQGSQVAIDGTGAIYAGGYFDGTVDFDPGAAFENRTSAGNADIYVTKLDSAGNYLWTRTLGSVESDVGYSVACDSHDNVYCTGCFMDTVDFDPGTGTDDHVSNGDTDAFLLKYLPDGSW
jgi:hypothetical protein